MKINATTVYIGLGVAVAAVLYFGRGKAASAGYAVGKASTEFIDGILSGTVVGIGETVGIPRTSQSECEKAKAEGRTWDASFACPAGNFIKYLFT